MLSSTIYIHTCVHDVMYGLLINIVMYHILFMGLLYHIPFSIYDTSHDMLAYHQLYMYIYIYGLLIHILSWDSYVVISYHIFDVYIGCLFITIYGTGILMLVIICIYIYIYIL